MTSVAAKQPRHNREELRELLLQTGQAILREEGLGTGAEVLTFKRVFDRVESDAGIRLTNASVIRRMWENQAEFQSDVLVAIAEDNNADELDRTVEAVAPILATVDLTTRESRQQALREICRVGGAANMDAVRESSYWPLSIAIWALAIFDEPSEQRKKIEVALASGYDAFTDQATEVYARDGTTVGRPAQGAVRRSSIRHGGRCAGPGLRAAGPSRSIQNEGDSTGPPDQRVRSRSGPCSRWPSRDWSSSSSRSIRTGCPTFSSASYR